MFKRILVLLDGSKLSEITLPYAEELAGALNSDVVLVSVCEPKERQYHHMHQLYMEKMAALVESGISRNTGAKVKSVVLLGEPAEELIEYIEKSNFNLIIMASHGRSGIMPWSMGSITSKLIHRISIPILLIRAGVPHPKVDKSGLFNKILIPLDGSDAGEAPLPYVRELTKKIKAEVILFQVVAPGHHVHTVGGLDYILLPEQDLEKMKADAQQYLEKVSRKLMGTKGTIKSEVKVGDAAQEIIKFADETNARLVAVSTHGHSGIRQWILGSVAQKVLQAGNTPVLLVRVSETHKVAKGK